MQLYKLVGYMWRDFVIHYLCNASFTYFVKKLYSFLDKGKGSMPYAKAILDSCKFISDFFLKCVWKS